MTRQCFVECPFCTDPLRVKVAQGDTGSELDFEAHYYRLTDYPSRCSGCQREFSGGIELTQEELAKAFQEGE